MRKSVSVRSVMGTALSVILYDDDVILQLEEFFAAVQIVHLVAGLKLDDVSLICKSVIDQLN